MHMQRIGENRQGQIHCGGNRTLEDFIWFPDVDDVFVLCRTVRGTALKGIGCYVQE